MIKSILELQEYTLSIANRFEDPTFKRRWEMTSPGCSKEDIEKLKKALPAIPDSYTQWVKAINLNGISVGYFEVCPSSFSSEGIVANLNKGNQNDVMFGEYMQRYHLYSVATTDGYGIFVATASSPYKEGEIIAINEDIYADKENLEKWMHRLAKDFEQFLIVAGNLNQVYREIKDDIPNYEKKREREFLERLTKLGVAEDYQKAWRNMF